MNVNKAFEITDAHISFVSLVNKAANKKQFLITKAEKGQADFSTCGRIVKTDEAHHYITGIVYEPMVEDAHGNYMSEEEIIKAAYWFAKNGDSVDIQHSFNALENATVVENWVAKSDCEIDGEPIKKGTWLITVEVCDSEVWEAVQKGDITGFSMAGFGKYSEEDIALDEVIKTTGTEPSPEEKTGIIKKLAYMLGITKGIMTDEYEKRSKASNFWNAFYTLEDVLYHYDYNSDRWIFESDEATIREALGEFSAITQSILLSGDITKSLAEGLTVLKAEEQPSEARQKTLKSLHDKLGNIITGFAKSNQEEELNVKKEEIQAMVDEAVKKALENDDGAQSATGTEATPPATSEPVTAEAVQKMVEDEVKKALEPKAEELTTESVGALVAEAVQKAIEPILKSRGVATNLDGATGTEQPVEKHYLAGIL